MLLLLLRVLPLFHALFRVGLLSTSAPPPPHPSPDASQTPPSSSSSSSAPPPPGRTGGQPASPPCPVGRPITCHQEEEDHHNDSRVDRSDDGNSDDPKDPNVNNNTDTNNDSDKDDDDPNNNKSNDNNNNGPMDGRSPNPGTGFEQSPGGKRRAPVEEQRTRFSGFKKIKDAAQGMTATGTKSAEFQMYVLFHSLVLLTATSLATLGAVLLVAGLRKLVVSKRRQLRSTTYDQIESVSSTLEKRSVASFHDVRSPCVEEFDIS